MELKASEIAKILNGKVEGNENKIITLIEGINTKNSSALSFLSNPKYEAQLYSTQAGVVLINEDLILKEPVETTLIRVKNAYLSYAKMLSINEKEKRGEKRGIEEPSYIAEDVIIDDTIYIGAFAYLGKGVKIGTSSQIYPHSYIGDNVTIGEETIIYSGARIYSNSSIGSNCIIHANAVIGSDGFGFAPSGGKYHKIQHVGRVVIHDDVEVGSNTCIDRATTGITEIQQGSKIDNLVQIGHNVKIGKNNVIAGQVGISGSTTIGNNCMIGGKAGITGHLQIADNAEIGPYSGVMRNIESGESVLGAPAFPKKKYLRSLALVERIPAMHNQISALKEKIMLLESMQENTSEE